MGASLGLFERVRPGFCVRCRLGVPARRDRHGGHGRGRGSASESAAGSASESDALVCESGAWSGANQRLGVGSLPYCSSRQFNERRLGLGPAAAAECYRDVRVMGLPSPSGATGRLPGRRSRLQPVILC